MQPNRRRHVLPAIMAVTFALAACGADDDAADSPPPDAIDTGATPGGDEPDEDGDEPGEGADGDEPGEGADGDEPGDETSAAEAGEESGTGDGTEDDESPQDDAGGAPGDGGDVPGACPEEVLEAGDDIANQFEHVEIGPVEGLEVLTCEWRAEGNGIASVEVSFSGELIGMDLADLEHSEEVTVAGVDGHVMHSEESSVNMFQFQAEGLFITGGSIDLEDIASDDVLVLAEAAIEALTS